VPTADERLYVLARHGQSTLNVSGRINGDPAVPVPLTEAGIASARLLGAQLRALPLGLAVHTRFERTRETAQYALAGRGVPTVVEPRLDDIDVGSLEGDTVEAYRAWKRTHTSHDAFPDGESLDDAALRYAEGFDALLGRPEHVVLVVIHEIPIRYAANAAAGSDSLDGPLHDIPNATPFLFDGRSLARAADGIRGLVNR
jgi:2,3-bisphosphoglycerate-dependent phosphoglycerate mutase